MITAFDSYFKTNESIALIYTQNNYINRIEKFNFKKTS